MLKIEKIPLNTGEDFSFDEVLLVVNGSDALIGTPKALGAKVLAKILRQARDKKKIVFRYKSKTRHKVKKGHRQPYTKVEILEIVKA